MIVLILSAHSLLIVQLFDALIRVELVRKLVAECCCPLISSQYLLLTNQQISTNKANINNRTVIVQYVVKFSFKL